MTLSMKGFLFTKALNEQTTKGKDQKNLTALQSRRAVLSKSTKKDGKTSLRLEKDTCNM